MSRFMEVYEPINESVFTWTTEQWIEYATEGSDGYFDIKKDENVIIKFIKRIINFIIKLVKGAFNIIKKVFIRIKRFIQGLAKYEGHGSFRIGGLYYLDSSSNKGLYHVYNELLTVWNNSVYKIADGIMTDDEAAKDMEDHYRLDHFSPANERHNMNLPLADCTIIVNTSNGDPFYMENLIDQYKHASDDIEVRCRDISIKSGKFNERYTDPKYQIQKLCFAFQTCMSNYTTHLMKDCKTIEIALVHAKRDMEHLELKTKDGWYYDSTGAHNYWG